jgi:REP element-mobilizing transposase RayT
MRDTITEYLEEHPLAYGGLLQKRRAGRGYGRSLTTSGGIHMVLRSSKAKGAWSFRRPGNAQKILALTRKFARKYGVKIHSMANVGNHLHLHIRLTREENYKPFIRALTASIAMAITKTCRWNPLKTKFWDYRPFTRLVHGLSEFLRVKDYLAVNKLEGLGYARNRARDLVAWRARQRDPWAAAKAHRARYG